MSLGPTVRLAGQVSFQFSAGARYTTTLVHDSIVTGMDVRPTLAPALAVALRTRLDDPWSAGATLDVSWSRLERHDQDGSTADLGGLGTAALTVDLIRRFRFGLAADAGVGGILYLPASKSGIFAQGTGGVTPLGALGVSYTPRVAARYRLALRARYDVHRFLTPALRSEGFPSGRFVHRVTLAVGWTFGAREGIGQP
jgi:hypothetical protein